MSSRTRYGTSTTSRISSGEGHWERDSFGNLSFVEGGSGNPFLSFLNSLTGAGLTGAQYASMSFAHNEAQLARDWDEEMYNRYNSPSALMAQYRDAGLNPALMYGQQVSGSAPTSGPVASSPVSASQGPTFSDLLSMAGLKSQIEVNKAEAENLRAGARKNNADAEGQEITNLTLDDLNRVKVYSGRAEIRKMEQDMRESESRVQLNGSEIQINGKRIELMDSNIDLNTKEAAVKEANVRLQNLSADQIAAILPYVAAQEQASLALKYAQTDEARAIAQSNYTTAISGLLMVPGILSDNERKAFEASISESEAQSAAIENKPGWVKARLVGDLVGKAVGAVATGAGIYFGGAAIGKGASTVSSTLQSSYPLIVDKNDHPLSTITTTRKF